MTNRRKDIHLSPTNDQLDDLTSALEAHRDGLRKLAADAKLGFGLDASYWDGRVADVQNLLDTVHREAESGSIESYSADREDS